MKALFYNPLPERPIGHCISLQTARIATLLATVGFVFGTQSLQAQDPDDLELISPKSEWKYNDSGEDLGTAWRGVNYDDSTWKSGVAPLGYGDADIATEVSFGEDSSNKIITQYYRKEFIAGSPATFPQLVIRVQRDDGISVYLNDSPLPVVRDNLPQDAVYDTRADDSVDGGSEKAFVETSVLTSFLKPGRNVIAVEVHQASPTSSDTRFDCQMFLSKVIPNYGGVRVGIQTQFTEAGFGAEFFERNTLADPPEIELNWGDGKADPSEGKLMGPVVVSGDQFALTTDREIVGDLVDIVDENGELDVQFFIWDVTLRKWESERIDTRNYNNVRVRVSVRTNDEDNGFETRDNFVGEVDYSSDGDDFDTVKWLELKGGGEKPIEWTEIINAETEKRAIVPSSAEEPGEGWMALDYDDSAWKSGVGGVGYETGSGYEDFIGLDLFEEMRSVNGATYIRIPFTVESLTDFEELQFRVRFDDGYVAFINGTEISRGNAPDTVAWDSLATSTNNDSKAVVFDDIDVKEALSITDLGEILNEGENVVTIIGLNTPVGSSDFLNDIVLRLGKPGEGIPVSLDALNFGAVNKLTTYESEVGLIPDTAATMKIRFEGRVDEIDGEVIYFDNVRTVGDPIAADSFFAYMQLETGWDLADPRIQAEADPDGDGITNLREYAFGSSPQISAREMMVQGEMRPIEPVWNNGKPIRPAGFVPVTYRQIAAPLAADGDDAGTEGFHVQDILYVVQVSTGEVDDFGDEIWRDGTAGGVPVVEQLRPFVENEDGTVQVTLDGVKDLGFEKEAYFRLEIRVVGFEQFEN